MEKREAEGGVALVHVLGMLMLCDVTRRTAAIRQNREEGGQRGRWRGGRDREEKRGEEVEGDRG